MKRTYSIILLTVIFGSRANAMIWLPSIIGDNMVLQQNSRSNLWGWTSKTGEDISLKVSWNDSIYETVAKDGFWQFQVPTPNAGGPHHIMFYGHDTLKISNIMIGEVWLCSGQSNMEWSAARGIINADKEIANANYPKIRFFSMPKKVSKTLQDDIPGQWNACTSETMKDFSAVGYFFGKELHQQLEVPIGLINASWGGTTIEPWIDKKEVLNNELIMDEYKKVRQVNWRPGGIGSVFAAMIHPIQRMTIGGTIWYQGESNRENPQSYFEAFSLLINSWRAGWQQDFPFYYAQIAPYPYDDDSTGVAAAIVQDAQRRTLSLPNTGMAVTNDIGDIKSMHPLDKQEVGRRLSLWALARTYGRTDIDFSGPIFSKLEIMKNKAIIHFEHAENGLHSSKNLAEYFELAGEDQVYVPAKTAKIKNNTIIITAPEVKQPVHVRFAFRNDAIHPLTDGTGLPASLFHSTFKPKDSVSH